MHMHTDAASRLAMRRLLREIEHNAENGLGATNAEVVFLLSRIAAQQEEITRLYKSDEFGMVAVERRPHRIGGRHG